MALGFRMGGAGASVPKGNTITPINDIQTWLKCAGIKANYTTINEVLSDTGVLQALMSTPNAADYMIRSTSWVSDICGNSNAMLYIGDSDYCANLVLNNSNWKSSILNSTYFYNVLTAKVPTMTSNTFPYGTAFGSGRASTSYDYWRVFDGSASSRWYRAVNSGTGDYVGYIFTKPVKIYRVLTQQNNADGNGMISSFRLEASNDGTDWYNLGSFNASSSVGGSNTAFPSLYTSATRYRIVVTGLKVSGGYASLAQLQFWGREDI